MTAGVLGAFALHSPSAIAQAACIPPQSNGDRNSCDNGDLCLWRNDPKDGYTANPSVAVQFYTNFCWATTDLYTLDNRTTILKNKWGVSVRVYQKPQLQ